MTTRQRPWTVRVALLCVLAIVLAACGGDDDTSAGGGDGGGGSDGGTLTVAINADPSSLDPQVGPSGTDHVVLYPMFDTLIDFDPAELTPEPGLAESWEFDDPTTRSG